MFLDTYRQDELCFLRFGNDQISSRHLWKEEQLFDYSTRKLIEYLLE